MGSTFLSLHCHIIFATKNRRPLIVAEWREKLHAYLGGTLRGLDAHPTAIGGVEDHVHLLVGLRATHCLADLVREVKKASTAWVREQGFDPDFGWQDGYAAFSVSPTATGSVSRYIGNQEEHHRRTTLVDELKKLLAMANVAFDSKYLE
jgi:REP element-mobilizing transposase RayT